MTFSCTLAWAAVFCTLPFLLLWRLSETIEARVVRLRRSGLSQRAIAERLGISRYRVRKACCSNAFAKT